MNLETILPAGRTEVTFFAHAPGTRNSTTSCHLTINVLDKENPRMSNCPQNIETEVARGQNSKVVYWNEPTFDDNVGIGNVYKSRVTFTFIKIRFKYIACILCRIQVLNLDSAFTTSTTWQVMKLVTELSATLRSTLKVILPTLLCHKHLSTYFI